MGDVARGAADLVTGGDRPGILRDLPAVDTSARDMIEEDRLSGFSDRMGEDGD